MRISVIGGSRGTGAALVTLAQQAGHDVTIVSRTGATATNATGAAGARIIAGSATDPAVAAQAVEGADAVVITVGGAKGHKLQRTEVTRSVVSAMKSASVKRLIVQSSLGAGGSAVQLPAVAGFITKMVLAAPLADHNRQESLVQNSALDWTIVRPTGLTNHETPGAWTALEITDAGHLKGSISRGDLAAFMLQSLTDDTTIGKAFGISSR